MSRAGGNVTAARWPLVVRPLGPFSGLGAEIVDVLQRPEAPLFAFTLDLFRERLLPVARFRNAGTHLADASQLFLQKGLRHPACS